MKYRRRQRKQSEIRIGGHEEFMNTILLKIKDLH